jgi:hypothetical protein
LDQYHRPVAGAERGRAGMPELYQDAVVDIPIAKIKKIKFVNTANLFTRRRD